MRERSDVLGVNPHRQRRELPYRIGTVFGQKNQRILSVRLDGPAEILNNSAFIVFWYFLFQQIGGEIRGFDFNGVMFLWALFLFFSLLMMLVLTAVRTLYHGLIPAALVGYIPVRVFKEFDPILMAVVVLADLAVVAAAIAMFRLGLRRYESGNRMATRL